jgi:FkbM family methyltransferase
MKLQIGEVGLEFRQVDQMLRQVVPEILGPYAFDEVGLKKGDVVIDVGAHRGAVAMYLARRYGATVYAYEPEPENFGELQWALTANKLTRRIKAYNLAVTADGRKLEIRYGQHSGEHGAWHDGQGSYGAFEASSVTLAEIFRKHRISRVKLLKLDCEGAEHEILATAGRLLERIEYLRGELHLNQALLQAGYDETTMERFPPERSAWQRVGG